LVELGKGATLMGQKTGGNRVCRLNKRFLRKTQKNNICLQTKKKCQTGETRTAYKGGEGLWDTITTVSVKNTGRILWELVSLNKVRKGGLLWTGASPYGGGVEKTKKPRGKKAFYYFWGKGKMGKLSSVICFRTRW